MPPGLQFDRLKMIEQRYDAGRLQIYRQGDQRHSGVVTMLGSKLAQ
jgi:hypothetical protein